MNGKHLTLALIGALLAVTMGWAQNISLLGQYDYWGYAYDVVKSGSYVYLVENGSTGFRVMDVSHPAAPVEVGHCPLPDYCITVAVNGSYAYAGSSDTLYVIDVFNPSQPQIVGQCPMQGYYLADAVVEYSYVYVADSYYGLHIVDVSNPANPIVAGSLNSSGSAHALAKRDSLVYLVNGWTGVLIIDVSNPSAPTPAGNFHTPNYARDLTIQGSLAYVLDGLDEWVPAAGLMTFNLSDPIHPTLLSSYGAYVRCSDIKVSGNYAYLASYYNALWIIDVSNPLAPQEVCAFGHDGNACSLHIEGSQLYLAGDGLTILNISNPPTPVWISQFFPRYGAREVMIQGSYAYIVNYYHKGLDVLDVSDPTDPELLSFCPSPVAPRNVAVNWPYAYLADLTGGLRIINVSNPQEPVEVSFYDPVSPNLTVSEVALDFPYAYLAGGSGGLVVLDVSDPLNPRPVSILTIVQPYLIKVVGAYAYTAQSSALRVFSLSDPIHPVQVGSITFSGTVQDMDVEGSYAYVTTSSTLYIFNVSNPVTPTFVTSSTAWEGYSLDAVGSLLYVVKSDFFVLNVGNPANPNQVGFYDLSNTAFGVTVVDSVAYVGRDYFFTAFDCSDCFSMLSVTLQPVNPPIVIPASGGSFQYIATVSNAQSQIWTTDAWIMVRLPNQTWYGPVLGPLYLTLPSGTTLTRQRLQNVPASAPAGIYLYEARIGDYPNQITAIDNFTFLKNAQGGESRIEDWTCAGDPFPGEEAAISQPSAFGLGPCRPNPFNASTAISYELRAASYVSLKVYDTAGRLVATLVDGWREAGTREVTFDGTGLASGIYLARLVAGEFTAVQKLVLIK